MQSASVQPMGQVKMAPVAGVVQAQVMPTQPMQAQVVSAGGMDFVAFQNLANVNNLEFKQGNVFWEAVSGGCIPNSYMLSDRSSSDAHGKMTPVFIMQEESDCYCRGCCAPNQPAFVKFYNVANGGEQPASKCCCITLQEARTRYNKAGEAIMTLEKPGCFSNCAQCGPTNCFVCAPICQSEAFMHTGNVDSVYSPQGCGPCCKVDHWDFPRGGPGKAPKMNVFSHAQVPILGGGCTPTVNIMERTGTLQGLNPPPATPFAVVEGPTCFGGCMDLCCQTKFMVSSQKGKAADIAVISKKAPQGACGMCAALCTPADTYNLDFNVDAKITPKQKAAIVGEIVHLDFLFFEAEQPLCRYNEENKMCYILLCTCYCFGALCPCELCIPCKSDG